MILRDKKSKPLTPIEKLDKEITLFAAAKTEETISSEIFAKQVAELICENAFCIADSDGNGITVKLLNGQIFKLTVQ